MRRKNLLTNLIGSLFHSSSEAIGEAIVRPVDLAPNEVAQEKPMRHHSERIVAGLGSGDSSDVNAYAKFDALSKAEQAVIRKRSQLPKMKDRNLLPTIEDGDVSGSEPKSIDAGAIADAMDHAYVRDPETKKLVLKDSAPQPDPNLGKDYK